jgi:transposase InsO family protein
MSAPSIPLPRGWPKTVCAAVVHIVALARLSISAARGAALNSSLERVRLRAALDEAKSEIALLEEEIRIKDARLARIHARHRPRYPPIERLAILSLRAARGWSLARTAKRLFVEPRTIALWMKRLDEEGPDALVKTPEPVNRFPEFVGEAARRLKTLCPTMGKRRIAQVLSRAALHLGVTTVRRMLKKRIDPRGPAPETIDSTARASRPVRAPRPHHTWQIDLTVVPTSAGMWVPWVPFAAIQRWPFAWWLAVVIDTFSREVIGFRVFASEPTSSELQRLLDLAIRRAGRTPKYLVSDKGSQFWSEHHSWCSDRRIVPRHASKGSLRATAIIERFFRSLKDEWLRKIRVPLTAREMRRAIRQYVDWYHRHRPHQGLGGRTPHEVMSGVRPANEAPRLEPRPKWPRRARCARPYARPKNRQAGDVALSVRFADDSLKLPIVRIDAAA